MQSDIQAHQSHDLALCPVGSSNRYWYSGNHIRGLKSNLDILVPVWEWAETILARPHKDLGRTGDVCPFGGEAWTRESAAAYSSEPQATKVGLANRVSCAL